MARARMDEHGNAILDRARPSLPDTSYTPPSYTYSGSSLSWWDQLNNFFIGIGNWLAENMEGIASITTMIAALGALIGLVIWVIGAFSEGFFSGVLTLFGAIIVGYIAAIAIGIASYVLGFILLAVRFVFWNIYTFLLAIVIGGFIMFSNVDFSSQNNIRTQNVKTEQVAVPKTTRYYCTANSSLNVRYSPSSNSRVIGALKKGQFVDVYEINSNGFAKIKYGNGIGYASSKYLRKSN